ncbi:hypothetical protein fugu_014295 [Takifugu bimaculatus]|uniref:G-protein coupled receptors family 1 profile domain-containing protein n=1 Tax=Takifugu bimaculatus TaxID=433685 RepID=A0A4Z2C0U2_9TELE|nr:hypothetical protein fugu_014295 [Takifugu bimaculatus]
MSYYEHIILDYDYNDTGSGSGSGELGIGLDEPCGVEHIMTADLQRVFLPVVYALIFIMGITGNGLVVLVLGCQRRSKCSLTDRYRLHLSAADLLFVLALPFWAVDAAMADWRFGAATCVGVHAIYTVNLYGSVLILAFISLDRYLAVVRATDTNTGGLRQLLAHRLVYAGAWLPAGLLAVPDLVFARTQEGGEGAMLCQRFYPEENAPLWVAVFHLQLVLVGPGDPRAGAAGLLLRHCPQADPGPPGGSEAEATSSQDHHCFGSLLLPVLAALRSGHLCGRPAAPGGPAAQLPLGGRPGRVAGRGGAHGVHSLLPEPAAVRFPGGQLQEFSPQSPDDEPSLQSEDSTTKASRDLDHHRVRILQFTFQLVFACALCGCMFV